MNGYTDYIGMALMGGLLAVLVAVIAAVWPSAVRRDVPEWIERVIK
jgi:hypothetical protein